MARFNSSSGTSEPSSADRDVGADVAIEDPPALTAGSRRLRILLVLGGATMISLFFTLQNVVGDWIYEREIELAWSLGTELFYWYLLALALPLALWLARRFRIERATWPRSVPVHVALALLLGVVHSVLYYGVLVILTSGPGDTIDIGWIAWSTVEWGSLDGIREFARESVRGVARLRRQLWSAIGRQVPTATLTVFWKYWVTIGVYYAYDYYRKYQERKVRAAALEHRLSEARLQALRTQLHPHFLFNTLHTASMLNEQDPEAASRVLTRLADLLRATLDEGASHEVPLATELSFVRRYLEIEKVRFGDRLSVKWDVPDELLDARVPTLLLQPLVENAVLHGVSRSPGSRRLEIGVRREKGTLVLEVVDDGPGLPEDWTFECDAGVGLTNTRDRLDALHGGRANLAIGESATGGVRATVRLPFRPPIRRDETGAPDEDE